ncbi:hypothetical protein AMS68_000229 [Peltaster fructicola]|uniref:DUF7726 domain-containing protein n=1 Tax=Peltaster fructicola TaxID=286661 RepID=A0A6H0XJ18_9PEZI|nr:hypothetical protein AMS68_000229 [Peltaster fructicola]
MSRRPSRHDNQEASGIKSGSKSSDRAPTKKQKIDTSGKTKASNTKSVDISNIRLDYEDDDDVPVFDTPEVIRQKISDHLREKDVTQASFLRDIWAELKGPRKTSRVFQSKQLKDFCSYTESAQGNRTAIFYAAYVYFEKLRIAEGKEKTNFRLGMEALWPCGFDTERDLGRAWCPAGTVPYTDDYGITRTRPESDAE